MIVGRDGARPYRNFKLNLKEVRGLGFWGQTPGLNEAA
jgi:hypothetical protein